MTDSTALLVIAVLSFIYVGCSLAINQKLGSRTRLKFIQAQVKEYQDEYKKAVEKDDKSMLEKLSVREKEVTGYMGEMMTLPFKALIFILPVFFFFIGFTFFGFHLTGIIQRIYPDFSVVLPIGLHLNEIFSLHIIEPSTYGARGFFVVCGIFAGIILEAIYSRYEASKVAKAQTPVTPAQMPPTTP